MANTRIDAFIQAASTLPQYHGRSADEIAGNVQEVFASGDTARIGRLTGALSALPQYSGRTHDEIRENLGDVFEISASPTPTLNFTAAPPTQEAPPPSLADDPQTAMAQLHVQYPDASAAELIQMYNSRTGYAPESDPLASTGREIQNPNKGQPQFLKTEKYPSRLGDEPPLPPGWGPRVDNDIYRLEKETSRVEKSDPGFWKSFDLGNMNVTADQLIFEANKTGNKDALARGLALRQRLGEINAKDSDAHEGFLSNTVHEVIKMAGPMGQSMAWAFVPGYGMYRNIEYWAEQGGGDMAARIAEAGGDPAKAKTMTAVAGAAYSIVEQIELGQFKNLIFGKAGKKATESLRKKLVAKVMEMAGVYAKEVGEEVVQEEIITAFTLGALKDQGYDISMSDALKQMKDAGIEELKGVAAPMAGMTLLTGGLGGIKGGYRHAVEAGRQKQQNAPIIRAAIDGKEIRDAETGEVFTPKPGAKRDKIRGDVRGWLRKHNNVEIVDRPVTEFGVKDEAGNTRDWSEFEGEPTQLDDDFNPVWLDDEIDTPWETQENTSKTAPETKVEEVSNQPEESPSDATEQAENKAEAATPEARLIQKLEDLLTQAKAEIVQSTQKKQEATTKPESAESRTVPNEPAALPSPKQPTPRFEAWRSHIEEALNRYKAWTGSQPKQLPAPEAKPKKKKAQAPAQIAAREKALAERQRRMEIERAEKEAAAKAKREAREAETRARVIEKQEWAERKAERNNSPAWQLYHTMKEIARKNGAVSAEARHRFWESVGNNPTPPDAWARKRAPHEVNKWIKRRTKAAGRIDKYLRENAESLAGIIDGASEEVAASRDGTVSVVSYDAAVSKFFEWEAAYADGKEFWKMGAEERERAADAHSNDAIDAAWKALSEAPDKMTLEQRRVIEDVIEDDLIKYLLDNDAPEDVIRAVPKYAHETEDEIRSLSDKEPDDIERFDSEEYGQEDEYDYPEYDEQNFVEAEPPVAKKQEDISNKNLFGESYAQTGEQQSLGLDGGDAAKKSNLPKHYDAKGNISERQKKFDDAFIETHVGVDLFSGNAGSETIESTLEAHPELRETYLIKWGAEFNAQVKQSSKGGQPDAVAGDLFGQSADEPDLFSAPPAEPPVASAKESAPPINVTDSDAIPEDQEALRAAERDAGAVAEEEVDVDADNEEEEASAKRTKKVKTVEADDIDILSGYEDKRTKKYIMPHSYKARKFELRHETRRSVGGSVYETTNGKDVYIGEAQNLDEASELMAAHINKTPGQTKNRTKMKSWTKGVRGYYDNEATVGSMGEANKDKFAEGAPKASDLQAVKLPELVRMVKEILGGVPKVFKRLRGGAYGLALHNKDGEWIETHLAADIAKEPAQARKTLAHEIGHILSKYGGTGKYLAVVQKIKNAVDTLKQFMEDDPGAVNLTPKDRKRIRKEAEDLLRKGEEWIDEVITQETPYTPQEIVAIWNSVDGATKTPELNEYIARLDTAQKKAVIVAAMRGSVPAGVPTKTQTVATGKKIPVQKDGKATPAEIAAKYKEMILKEAELRRLTEVKTIYDELYALSKKWRPFEEGRDPSHDKYRKKGEEVFADAISVYLNDPAMLEAEAPNFWRVFHGWEGERNPFTGVYKSIQELYGKGEEAVAAERSKNLREGFDEAEEAKDQEKNKRTEENKEELSLLNLARTLYRALFDRYSNLGRLVKDIQRAGVAIADKVNPYLNKRSQPYVRSQQSAYLLDVYNSMEDIIGDLDKGTIDDIGEYLTYARISMGDRGEIWNVQGLDVEASELGLKHLKKRLGDKRFGLVEEAAQKFAELREEHIVKEIVDSGAFSKEYIEKVIKNKRYATFDVLRRLGREYGAEAVKAITGLESLPVGAHKQIGTTRNIRNPLLATLENDMKMLAFIDRNNFAKNAIDLLTTHTNTLGFEAKRQWPRGGGNLERFENTVFILRDGKREAYQVSKELVSSFKNPKKANALLRATDKVNNVVRDLITQKNPAFWVWNFQRDFRSFHRNVEGSVWRKVAYLAKAYPKIWQYTAHGIMDVDVKAALMERAMLPSSAYSKENMFDQDREFFRSLDRFETEGQKAGYCKRLIDKILHGLDTVNDTMELATKLAGHMMLKENSDMSAEKRAHTVRTRVGTPDIYAGGEATPWTNRVFMFSNVNLQGLRESLAVIKENPGRAAMLSLMYSAVPAMLTVLAERGLLSGVFGGLGGDDGRKLGEWLEKAWAKIPRFDRVYRWALPLPMETTSGKQFYIPLPKSEMGMVIQGIAYHAINMAFDTGSLETESDDVRSIIGDAMGVSPFGLGSLHPALKVGLAATQYAGGENPMDYYHNQKIIPQKDYRVSTAKDATTVGKFMWNNIGGATIWRIDDKALNFKDKDWFEIALGLPVAGNPLGRFVRVSDRGLEEAKQEKKADKAMAKKRRAEERKNQK